MSAVFIILAIEQLANGPVFKFAGIGGAVNRGQHFGAVVGVDNHRPGFTIKQIFGGGDGIIRSFRIQSVVAPQGIGTVVNGGSPGYRAAHGERIAAVGSHAILIQRDGRSRVRNISGDVGDRFTSHDDVVAGVHCSGIGVAAGAAPVCHNHTVESPFLAQNVGQKFIIVGSRNIVDFIIGTHNVLRLAALDSNLKSLQINFAKSPLRNHTVGVVAVGFLVVCCKVLESNSASRYRLNTLTFGSGGHTGNQRILGIILEVASAERIPVDVHARCQPNVNACICHVISDGLTHVISNIRIPGLRNVLPHRIGGAVLIVGGAVFIKTLGNTKAGRTVGICRVRNQAAFRVKPGGLAGFTRYIVIENCLISGITDIHSIRGSTACGLTGRFAGFVSAFYHICHLGNGHTGNKLFQRDGAVVNILQCALTVVSQLIRFFGCFISVRVKINRSYIVGRIGFVVISADIQAVLIRCRGNVNRNIFVGAVRISGVFCVFKISAGYGNSGSGSGVFSIAVGGSVLNGFLEFFRQPVEICCVFFRCDIDHIFIRRGASSGCTAGRLAFTVVNHLVCQLLGNNRLVEGYNAGRSGIAGAVADTDDVVALFHDISGLGLAVGGHIRCIEGQCQSLALARCQIIRLSVGCQFLVRFVQLTCRSGKIYLNDFLAAVGVTGISYLRRYRYLVSVRMDGNIADVEGCIGKAIAKLIVNLVRSKCIEIAVTNIDTFIVILNMGSPRIVRVDIAEIFGGRIIVDILCPGIYQFAGRRYGIVQIFYHGIAGKLTRVAHQKNSIHTALLNPGAVDGGYVQKNNHFLEFFTQKLQIIQLFVRQIPVTLRRCTVRALAGIAADGINGGVRLSGIFRYYGFIQRRISRHGGTHHVGAGAFHSGGNTGQIAFVDNVVAGSLKAILNA